ncbi:MAG: glycosyltransferase family 9 protein, partial [Chloroflexota bacterium]|nr:glycosyltransferase family 9 protein [Chloroflexota bacterium]
VERILVVELWNIGDVILTIPFLAQLRVMFPNARTTLLARSYASELLVGMDLVDEFLETDINPQESWLMHGPRKYNLNEVRRIRRRLRERKFDVAFQCRLHVREHVILAMSGAHRRVGYAFGPGDGVLTDAVMPNDGEGQKFADWLRLLGPFDGPLEADAPRMHVTAAERAWAEKYLVERGVSATDVVVGIHPGASLPEKRWPLDRFLEVANRLSIRPGVRILGLVDPEDYGKSLDRVHGAISAKVGLRELIALVERCALLICNDSGPMHIAGGLGVPTVAIFGAGIAQWFAPLGGGHEVVSGEGTIAEIPTDAVLDAVDRAFPRSVAI